MNLVFGTVSDSAFDLARRWVQQRYGQELERIWVPTSAVSIGIASDGPMLTHTINGGCVCILLGQVHSPVPTWTHAARPVDDAEAVAQLILDRYHARPDVWWNDLEGQFAVCMATADQLILGTDSGMRTWFFDERVDQFAFSSNLRLLAETRVDLEMDRTHEDFLLINGYLPPLATPYVSLRSMPGGEQLTYDGASLQDRKQESPTASPNTPKPPSNEPAVIDALYDVFMASLEDQVSEMPRAGVLLGGFDSALVAAGLAELGKEVDTYSFSYQDESFNQPFAEDVARAVGGSHHWVLIGPDDVKAGLRDYTDYFNRPTNWPNYVISTAVACLRMVDDGVEQCFSGDGCDSIFLGYPGTARRARVISALNRLPSSAYRVLLSAAGRPWLDRRLGHPYRVLLGLLRGSQRENPARTYLSFRILDEISVKQLRSGEDVDRTTVEALGEDLAAPYASLSNYRLAYQGKSAVSPNKNKMIGAADASGLTIWSPYMHPRMKTFASALPETLMRPEHRSKSAVTGKYILQQMAVQKGLLPAEIVYQPKVAAVDAPVDQWYTGELKSTLYELWSHLPFDLNWEYAETLVETSFAERGFRDLVMVDKVISHAASLLATYAAFAEAANNADN